MCCSKRTNRLGLIRGDLVPDRESALLRRKKLHHPPLHPSSRSYRYLASTIYPKQNDQFVYRSDHEPLNNRSLATWLNGSNQEKRERDLQLNGVAALGAGE
ncbi:hypothetical protein FRX31_017448 [Thalictrum thalictroides]|uniref:Uncharacterized protein n=1 Tax=Thalictrum thalictroides TaxID=46969 RepID=A0A7J6W6G0_THATH|nr:hypothetical protein FRX31_017448 [Thalictrum thalictroides]